MDIATTVVRSRNLQGIVMDTRTLRDTAEVMHGPASTSVTAPDQCTAFRLPLPGGNDVRRTDTGVSFAEGRLPLDPQASERSTIVFMMRSAPNDQLAAADFNGTGSLTSQCTTFERTFTDSVPGGAPAGIATTYTVQLLTAPAVGQTAYATVQKAKGLGEMDMGTAGMQVLAGTVSIDMALTVWPVNPGTTEHAIDSMAGFARQLIDQSVKNPPGSPQPNPAGARSPEELTQLLTGATGPAATKYYVSPTEARVITRTPGPSPLPSPAKCGYDDDAYSQALAGGATMAQAIASTEDKAIALDVTVISTGTSVQPPYPFDTRSSGVAGCTTIQANTNGQGALSWAPVEHLDVKLDAESSYAFSYQAAEYPGRWYVRLGARRGSYSVEVGTANWRPLGQDNVTAAVDAATTIIEQVLSRAGGGQPAPSQPRQ